MDIVIFALLFIASVVQGLPPPTSPGDLHMRSNAPENILSPRVLQAQELWDSPTTKTLVLAQDRPDDDSQTFPDAVESYAEKYHNVNWETMVVFISMSGIYTLGIPLTYLDEIFGKEGEVKTAGSSTRAKSREDLVQEVRLTEGFGGIELLLFGINGCSEGAFQAFQNQESMTHPITDAFIWTRESKTTKSGETYFWTPVADAIKELIEERLKGSIVVKIQSFRTNPADTKALTHAMVYQRVSVKTLSNQLSIITNLWLGARLVFHSHILV
ncbi:uncharacterized protein N7459_009906 [Penicillium hispanicum]|uniref:uncharacterized protein n=1 Tax=Penicillium hispanicum TaxID=1080232 RepID=UPI0025421639|nr:uncharacterized protein N7459_009906 [Penicillium hispanicum]KAJ5570476.1 hypothetical protein N7459_009906 [Penicillium hispanicum]